MKLENSENPYEPATASEIATATDGDLTVDEGESRSDGIAAAHRLAFVCCLTAVVAIGKWFLPGLLGTGDFWTMGTWFEEVAVLLILGFVCRVVDDSVTGLLVVPALYYLVGYVLLSPMLMLDKFGLLVMVLGFGMAFILQLVMAVTEAIKLAMRYVFISER